jgi:hypothetical protein
VLLIILIWRLGPQQILAALGKIGWYAALIVPLASTSVYGSSPEAQPARMLRTEGCRATQPATRWRRGRAVLHLHYLRATAHHTPERPPGMAIAFSE